MSTHPPPGGGSPGGLSSPPSSPSALTGPVLSLSRSESSSASSSCRSPIASRLKRSCLSRLATISLLFISFLGCVDKIEPYRECTTFTASLWSLSIQERDGLVSPDSLLGGAAAAPDDCTALEGFWVGTMRAQGTDEPGGLLALVDSLLSIADTLAGTDPYRGKLLAWRGWALKEQGQWEDARPALDSAIVWYDRRAWPDALHRAQLVTNSATAHAQTGFLDEAFCRYEFAIDLLYSDGRQTPYALSIIEQARAGRWDVERRKPTVTRALCTGYRYDASRLPVAGYLILSAFLLFRLLPPLVRRIMPRRCPSETD